MKDAKIAGIFPTPVYLSKLNRKFTKKELSLINKCKVDSHNNVGNVGSNENYILNHDIFNNLKKEIDLKVKDYFKKVICITDEVTPYITQSWLNFTETNQFHHKHEHPNSLVSGVLYINCDKEFDKIKFFNNEYKIIKPEVKEWNLWNSESWWFPVKTGDLILFPSSLTHTVEAKEGTNTRISLAFNTFVKGVIGNNRGLTELKL
tara:strand:+ start:708 stop:1322 length:615 start_codon:yes stop_codon:yes gene_type:complete